MLLLKMPNAMLPSDLKKLFDAIISHLFCRRKQEEVMNLEEQIRAKADHEKKAGNSLDSTCQICLKTKFADGIGHTCNYCNVKCCARCGGKVALRSSRVCGNYFKHISRDVIEYTRTRKNSKKLENFGLF